MSPNHQKPVEFLRGSIVTSQDKKSTKVVLKRTAICKDYVVPLLGLKTDIIQEATERVLAQHLACSEVFREVVLMGPGDTCL